MAERRVEGDDRLEQEWRRLQKQQQDMRDKRNAGPGGCSTRMCKEGVCEECNPKSLEHTPRCNNEPSEWRTLPKPRFAKKGNESALAYTAKAKVCQSWRTLRDSSVARCSGLMPFCLANRCRCRRTTSAPSTASTLGPQSEGSRAKSRKKRKSTKQPRAGHRDPLPIPSQPPRPWLGP